MMESLEPRRLLSTTPVDHSDLAYTQELTRGDVERIVAQAASQATPGQVISVADRDGHLLAVYQVSYSGATLLRPSVRFARIRASVDRAVTASFFESTGEAFTTRTARFIIQDNFPPNVQNTAGGPLYGVQFSSQAFSDVFAKTGLSISGDPGGVPLFKNGVPVGGIGVSGDGSDTAPRADLIKLGDGDYNGHVYNGREESDFDESVAMAGAVGYMASAGIRADQIFIGGLRLPFTNSPVAHGQAAQTFESLVSSGAGQLVPFSNGNPNGQNYTGGINHGFRAFPLVNFHGVEGELRDPIIAPHDGLTYGVGLTKSDITRVLTQGVAEALSIRGGIREPVGLAARVHVTVVDAAGNVVGTFRMNDGTNFSYDVAVQKARTALFFSTNTAAISTRAVEFMAQAQFPPGQSNQGTGPLFHLQNEISVNGLTGGILRDGITIFPGGFPLYKNGLLVGAVGVSGDGVDQDDEVAYAGTSRFRPPQSIQSDHLSDAAVRAVIESKFPALSSIGVSAATISSIDRLLKSGFESVQLPYVKFPRNPGV
jgi:uncharacterized protein GlcG (DUF336 family)